MKQIYVLLAIIMLPFLYVHSQDWKSYPYEPEGSLISFPVDEGRHTSEPVEWWYSIGHLKGETTGTNYSYMLTYFYMNYPPYQGFRIFNVTNEDNGQFFSDVQPVTYATLAEDSLNLVVKTGFLGAGTETWKNKTNAAGKIPFEYEISAQSQYGALNLEYVSEKPPLILGDDGYFPQGQDTYTYYYSQTKNTVSGSFTFNGTTEAVTGTTWIDRQYGTFNPSTGEKYEWFCLQLSNGMDINVWDLFNNLNEIPDNALYRNISVYVDEDSSYTNIDFNIERLGYRWNASEDRCYSKKWRLTSDVNDLDLIITAPVEVSEVTLPFQFYEGSINIEGSVNGNQVNGVGYAELLHSYFNPEVLMHQTEDNTWNATTPITWEVTNPDAGRPVFYDLYYSVDNKDSFIKIDSVLTASEYMWEGSDLTSGQSAWFKVEAYSVDSTLNGEDSNNEALTVTNASVIHQVYDQSLSIYPNPATEYIHISYSKSEFSGYVIYDVTGNTLVSDHILDGNSLTISVKHLDRGLYFIKLRARDHTKTKQFIKK